MRSLQYKCSYKWCRQTSSSSVCARVCACLCACIVVITTKFVCNLSGQRRAPRSLRTFYGHIADMAPRLPCCCLLFLCFGHFRFCCCFCCSAAVAVFVCTLRSLSSPCPQLLITAAVKRMSVCSYVRVCDCAFNGGHRRQQQICNAKFCWSA